MKQNNCKSENVRCPLHYPQGGFHSLIPFPLNHFTFPIPIPCPSEFRNEYGDEIRSFDSEQSERLFARDAGYQTFAQPVGARTPHHRLVFGQQPR